MVNSDQVELAYLVMANIYLVIFLSCISDYFRDTIIEVKTPTLKKIGKNGFLQCTALSKRPDIIMNANDTYIINVDGNS